MKKELLVMLLMEGVTGLTSEIADKLVEYIENREKASFEAAQEQTIKWNEWQFDYLNFDEYKNSKEYGK